MISLENNSFNVLWEFIPFGILLSSSFVKFILISKLLLILFTNSLSDDLFLFIGKLGTDISLLFSRFIFGLIISLFILAFIKSGLIFGPFIEMSSVWK